ncbi:hypothetical protein [Microbacterium candidum]|uniref:Uncharacterized protein n=1 Tax=Microbacterium candidum TaxID=3041922 RepID=A0ABT7MX32_9MICO|nr:hypothetical protein [Microbacterium sp. ASV49]MDL9979015.1 hypothetical protein [Microbacterium sp. ASV49]
MPTARPRHMITETDDIRDAIDRAAEWWPELHGNRAAILRRLITDGARSGAEAATQKRLDRWRALDEVSGIFTGVYPPNAARQLVEEWPE